VTLDSRAVGTGAIVALLITVPAGFVGGATSPNSSWHGLTIALALIGFGVGGAIAGRSSTQRYLTAGAAAGFVAVVAYLVIGIVARQVTDHHDQQTSLVASLVFTTLLAMCCGMVGAELGSRWRRRHSASPTRDGAP
jgi:hypothetical protein